MHNKERAVSSEQSNGNYFEMDATSTPAKVETFTLPSLNYVGLILDGVESSNRTGNWPSSGTIDIMIDVLCVRRLATALTMVAERAPYPTKLRLTYKL